MTSIRVTVDDHGLVARLRDAAAGLRPLVWREVVAGALDVQRTAVESIQKGARTGRVYEHRFAIIKGKLRIVGKRKGANLSATHRASAPGEPPARDTGALASSIHPEYDEANLAVIVRVGAKHGLYLERGTRGRHGIKPRPFMRPAADANREEIIRRIREAVTESMQ